MNLTDLREIERTLRPYYLRVPALRGLADVIVGHNDGSIDQPAEPTPPFLFIHVDSLRPEEGFPSNYGPFTGRLILQLVSIADDTARRELDVWRHAMLEASQDLSALRAHFERARSSIFLHDLIFGDEAGGTQEDGRHLETLIFEIKGERVSELPPEEALPAETAPNLQDVEQVEEVPDPADLLIYVPAAPVNGRVKRLPIPVLSASLISAGSPVYNAPGMPGQFRHDALHAHLCIAPDAWIRWAVEQNYPS